MEFLLNRATISSYGHCGLTSTSWGKKKTFLHIPWLGSCKTLEQKHAAASQTLQVVKVVLRVHGLVGKFLRAQNDWAGSSLQQTYLSKKDKKNQKNLTWNPATEYKKHCLKQP